MLARKDEDTEDDEAQFFSSSSPAETSGRPKIIQKYSFDSVTIPSSRSRSKLGQEQTTSADNLTLGSPISKKLRKTESLQIDSNLDLDEDEKDEQQVKQELETTPVKARSTRKGKLQAEQAPFNIGKFSRVSKASASSLALDDEKKPSIKTQKGGAAKGRKSTNTKPKIEILSSDELNLKDEEDFALDDDEEESQLKEAIRKSALGGLNEKFSSRDTSGVNTPASSVPKRIAAKGKGGKGKGKVGNASGTSTEMSTRESTPVRSRGKRKAAISSAESMLTSHGNQSLISITQADECKQKGEN